MISMHPKYVTTDDGQQTTDNGRRTTGNIPLDATSIYFYASGNAEVMRPGEEGLWQQLPLQKKLRGRPAPALVFR